MKRLLLFLLLTTACFAQTQHDRITSKGINDSGTSTFVTARFKGQPWYDVMAYGILCDGSTDDTAAIQTLLDTVVAAGGGVMYFPPNKTCVIDGTVSETGLNNVTLLGYGTTLDGGTSGAILNLGDVSGVTYSTHVRILGFTVTNGAWVGGTSHVGDSTQDGIVLRTMKYADIDIHAVELGGRALVIAGTAAANFEWSKVRVNAFDVGTPLYMFQANNIEASVNSRRAHTNSAYLWSVAGVDLNIESDETLQPSSPGTTDGVGVFMNAADWNYVHGVVVACKLEAVKVYGNSHYNRIVGVFGDSSTISNAYTANIVLDTDGTFTPSNNSFNVWAGYTGLQGTSNKPTYGIQSVASTSTIAVGLDATGVGTGAASSGVQIMGGFVGPSKQMYYNLGTSVYEIHGQSNYGFDLDTDIAGGTPTFKVTAHNGTVGILNCNDSDCIVGTITNSSGTGRIRFTNNQFLGWRNAANSANLTAGYNASDVFAISGSASIGGGTAITKHLSATASLDFAAWSGTDCQDKTITVTGAVDGNTVKIGVPNALASTAGVQFSGFVSAADTVTIRGCKITAGASADPAAATVRADVDQH